MNVVDKFQEFWNDENNHPNIKPISGIKNMNSDLIQCNFECTGIKYKKYEFRNYYLFPKVTWLWMDYSCFSPGKIPLDEFIYVNFGISIPLSEEYKSFVLLCVQGYRIGEPYSLGMFVDCTNGNVLQLEFNSSSEEIVTGCMIVNTNIDKFILSFMEYVKAVRKSKEISDSDITIESEGYVNEIIRIDRDIEIDKSYWISVNPFEDI